MVQKLNWTKQTVKISTIKFPFYAMHSQFDLDIEEDFVNSIREVGVIEPVKLINVKECPDPGLYLVDGRHRLNETKDQQETIEALVADGSTDDVIDYNVVLNRLRGHSEPHQLALLIDLLAKDHTYEELAERWHMSKSHLSRLRKIVKHREVFNAWRDRKINFDEAVNIVVQHNNVNSDDSDVEINQALQDTIDKKSLPNDSEDSFNGEDNYVGACVICGQPIKRKQSRFLTVHKDPCTNQFFETLGQMKHQSHDHDKSKYLEEG